MSSVAHLVPKADPDIEQVIAHPFGLYEMVKWLKERGCVWEEPKDKPLTMDELRTIVRVVYRELRMRENESGSDVPQQKTEQTE